MQLITKDGSTALDLYGWADKGVLPFPDSGGVFDQPAKLMQAIRIVGAEVSRIEESKLNSN